MKMTESEKNLWLNGDSGLKPYLRLKDKGMPRGKIEQIAWLLLNGSGCGFCKVCRDKSCDVKDGEGCTGNIARYIRETVINELDKEKLKLPEKKPLYDKDGSRLPGWDFNIGWNACLEHIKERQKLD